MNWRATAGRRSRSSTAGHCVMQSKPVHKRENGGLISLCFALIDHTLFHCFVMRC